MKLFSYILLSLIVLAGLGLFIIKDPNGQPILNWRQVINDSETTLRQVSSKTADLVSLPDFKTGQSQAVEVYTWVDDKGVTHYSDKPVNNAAKVALKPVTVVDAVEVQWPESKKAAKQQNSSEDNTILSRVSQAKKQAEEATKALEKRYQKQQEILNNLNQ